MTIFLKGRPNNIVITPTYFRSQELCKNYFFMIIFNFLILTFYIFL